ncbi:MAG: GtrA family protein [Saccharofermentans sp.]|nr:GtrA family protein [Saccharofermentans sp.]
MIDKLKKLCIKYKSFIMYGIFGVLTTVVNYFVYWLCARPLSLDPMVSNTIAWVAGVAFAYVTNRKYVFESQENSTKGIIRELGSFTVSRLFTYFVEQAILFVFVKRLGFNDLIIKLIANVVVIILNYVLSKLIVFKKKHE